MCQYQDLPESEYASALEGFGLTAALAQTLASSDNSIKRGEMQSDSTDLRQLIGHPTTLLKEGVAAQLSKQVRQTSPNSSIPKDEP